MSEDYIKLHPTKGVNPHMGMCPRCGKDNGEILLLGAVNKIYKCKKCDTMNITDVQRMCQKCGDYTQFQRELEDFDKIPSNLCKDCEAELEEHKQIVEEGGVYFTCSDCGVNGVIRPNEFTEAIRKHAGIAPPNLLSVEFSKDNCPAECGKR